MKVAILTMFNGITYTYSLVTVAAEHHLCLPYPIWYPRFGKAIQGS